VERLGAAADAFLARFAGGGEDHASGEASSGFESDKTASGSSSLVIEPQLLEIRALNQSNKGAEILNILAQGLNVLQTGSTCVKYDKMLIGTYSIEGMRNGFLKK
jgi:hypothetical protein